MDMNGLKKVEVSLSAGDAVIEYDEKKVSIEKIVEQINNEGYEVG